MVSTGMELITYTVAYYIGLKELSHLQDLKPNIWTYPILLQKCRAHKIKALLIGGCNAVIPVFSFLLHMIYNGCLKIIQRTKVKW